MRFDEQSKRMNVIDSAAGAGGLVAVQGPRAREAWFSSRRAHTG